MNTQIFATLRPEFVMNEQDMNSLKLLPDNMPETKLTKKQIETVSGIYHKYINGKITRGWGQDLAEFEQKSEKWPSGPRVKIHEAQRMILGNLLFLNESKKELTAEQAASFFHGSMNCRESYTILIGKAYSYERV